MMKTIDDLAVADQRVLVRDDLNVPLDGGRVADDGRIRAALPTLVAVLDRDAAAIVCAHLGRPDGKPDPKYSLAPVALRLGELLGREVRFAANTVGPGGAKVADKFDTIGSLITAAGTILVGGAMAFPFLVAQGHKVGTSLLDAGLVDAAAGYLEQADRAGTRMVLPPDVIVAAERSADAPHQVVSAHATPADQMGLDIGPESAGLFAASIRGASTVFWNGPMGVFELPAFARR